MPRLPDKAPRRLLILGGTGEALEIAARLQAFPELTAISSLAGRVASPNLPEGAVRIGGFGGVPGLIAFLREQRIDLVIDATHPFASSMSAHADTACTSSNLPLIRLARRPWQKLAGDQWFEVPSAEAAARFLTQHPGRVFLSIGRQELGPFLAGRPSSLLIRCIDPPDFALPPGTQLILDRGPFDLEHELALLREHKIQWLVSKNSGGPATYPKIEAARHLGLPVVMIDAPDAHSTGSLASVDDVFAELDRLNFIGNSTSKNAPR